MQTRSLVMTLDGQFNDAVEGMKQVVARNPSDAQAWGAYGRVLVNAEQPVAAEQAVRHAMRLNPFYPINYLAVLADALVHQGRSQEALDVLDELVRRQPNYISAHLHRAGLIARSERWSGHGRRSPRYCGSIHSIVSLRQLHSIWRQMKNVSARFSTA